MLMVTFLRTHAEQIARNLGDTASDQRMPSKRSIPPGRNSFATLFVAGAVAIYLEDYVSLAEASAYVLMERKVHGTDTLPGVISVFRRYLKEVERGRYTTLMDCCRSSRASFASPNRTSRVEPAPALVRELTLCLRAETPDS